MDCPHCSETALRYAPVPCTECRGWVESNRNVITTKLMLQRYPAMRAIVAQSPKGDLPYYAGPTRSEQFFELNRIVGALARSGLAIIFAGLALVILVAIIVIFAKG